MGFNLEDRKEWVKDYRKVWKVLEDQLFVTFMSDPVKEGVYLNGKLKNGKTR